MPRKICPILLSVLLSAVSCVYPYEPESSVTDASLVITGDIVPGGSTVITLSELEPLSGTTSAADLGAEVWVESSEGATWKGTDTGSGSYTVDTEDADPTLSYRLCAKVGGRTYHSDWESSEECRIDDLYYSIDRTSGTITFYADFSSDSESRSYEVRYNETWEFHTDFYGSLYYIPFPEVTDPDSYRYGQLVPYPAGENYYYCWKSSSSTGKRMVSSESYQDNSVKGCSILSMTSSDQRISICYRLTVSVSCMSDGAYRYAQHREQISSGLGDLFSPIPSEMRGNVSCDDDPDAVVIGYVGVAATKSATIYEIESSERFYRDRGTSEESEPLAEEQWPSAYASGLRPVYGDANLGYYWAAERCVDCRIGGGSKSKPEGWPTSDK